MEAQRRSGKWQSVFPGVPVREMLFGLDGDRVGAIGRLRWLTEEFGREIRVGEQAAPSLDDPVHAGPIFRGRVPETGCRYRE